MKIFVCLDDSNGMMFNHRRQSRDIKVIEDMICSVGDKELMLNRYSKNLFEDVGSNMNLFCSDRFLDEASQDMYCFVENEQLCPYEERIQEIIIYRWNRMYPSDMKLDINLDAWILKETTEFEGNSHKNIMKEVYTK